MHFCQDTDNSISDILEIFRNLRQEDHHKEDSTDKQKQNSTFSFDSKLLLNREEQTQPIVSKDFQFYSSIRPPLSSARQNRTSKSRQAKENLFTRLYQENIELKKRRDQLFKEGKKKKQMDQVKQCTFKPQTLCPKNSFHKSNEEQSQYFYKRNLEWKSRIDQAVKLRQVESSKQNLKQLTFSPRILHKRSQSRNRSTSKDSVTNKKGVSTHLERQKKARNAQDLLKSRWASLNGTAQLNQTQPNFIF